MKIKELIALLAALLLLSYILDLGIRLNRAERTLEQCYRQIIQLENSAHTHYVVTKKD